MRFVGAKPCEMSNQRLTISNSARTGFQLVVLELRQLWCDAAPACQYKQEALLQNILLMIFTFTSSLLNYFMFLLYTLQLVGARLTDALIRRTLESSPSGKFSKRS